MEHVPQLQEYTPLKVVQTLDDFKTNCVLLEENLKPDHSDPKNDLAKLISWVDWIARGHGTTEHELYFYNEALPKITRALLSRKYLSDVNHTDEVFRFLMLIANLISDKLMDDYEGLIQLLPELLDPNKSFYLKHGFPKPVIAQALTANASMNAWKEALEVGSFFDAKSPSGVWEMVMVDSISPTQTEVEVTWSTGQKEWLSLEDNSRVAEFASKTTDSSNDVICEVPTAPVQMHVTELSPTEDEAWRKSICVGSVLDCKDKQGTWFQAAVIDSRIVRKQVKIETTNSTNTGAVSADLDLDVTRSLDSDLYPDPNGKTSEDVTVEYVSYDDTELRIAYLGWPERCDDWVSLTSPSLKPLNMSSFSRRGDGPIRAEIKHLCFPLLAEGEDRLWAVRREPGFFSSYYVDVVQHFGPGFQTIMQRLKSLEVVTLAPKLRFSLIEALTAPYEVYSTGMLMFSSTEIFNVITTTLLSLTMPELRNVTRDTLESALKGLERFVVTSVKRLGNAAPLHPGQFEAVYLGLAKNCLSTRYLNRRLDGLKMVTDMITRVRNKQRYPLGLKRTTQTNSMGEETSITYDVLPLAYLNTAQDLARWISENQVLPPLFSGSQAHTSLMERCFEIVKFQASENMLEDDIVDLLWEVGKGLGLALTALKEAILYMNNNLLLNVFGKIEKLSDLEISSDVIDLVNMLGRRTRDLVVNCYTESPQSEPVLDDPMCELHRKCLHLLWRVADESSPLPDAAVARAVATLDELATCNATAFAGLVSVPPSIWVAQWVRTVPLIEWCIRDLRMGRNNVTCLKVLQTLISAWPKGNGRAGEEIFALFSPLVPFDVGTRTYVSEYLENTHKVVELVVSSAVRLKEDLTELTKDIVSESLSHAAILPVTDAVTKSGSSVGLPDEIQNVINEYTVPNKRGGYLDELTRMLDFVQFFVRSSEACVLSQESIARVWNSIVICCVTKRERDTLYGWLARIAIRQVQPQAPAKQVAVQNKDANASGVSKEDGHLASTDAEEEDGGTQEHRIFVCNDETIGWIFSVLLSDERFISGPNFSDTALNCLEKYFRYINVKAGALLEVGAGYRQFKIKDTNLEGLDVFWQVIQHAMDDIVAERAVKFLTSLPQKLVPGLLSIGKLAEMRVQMLTKCTELLHAFTRNSTERVAENQAQTELRRLLFVLNTLLDESAADAHGKLRTHGSASRGAALRIRINCIGKLKKPDDPHVCVYTNDSGEDVLGAIARVLGQRPHEIKLFRLGKELNLDDRKKSLGELRMTNGEAVMVALKQPASSAAKSGESADEENVEVDVPTETLPAFVLSQGIHFTLLFELLESTRGEVCDVLWKLLMRLPTNKHLLKGWLKLDRDMYALLGMESDDANLKSQDGNDACCTLPLARVLYSLQILEGLMQPAETEEETHTLAAYMRADIGDEDTNLADWPERFIHKGGVEMLCSVLSYHPLFSTRTTYTYKIGSLKGVTHAMLTQTLKLLLKMTYACVRQAVFSAAQIQEPSGSSEGLQFLRKEMMSRLKRRGASLVNPFDDDDDDKKQTPTEASNSAEPEAQNVGIREWGFRLSFEYASFANEVMSKIDIPTLQARLYDIMVILRALAPVTVHVPLTSPATTSPSTGSGNSSSSPSSGLFRHSHQIISAVTFVLGPPSSNISMAEIRREILEPLDDLLGLWGMCALWQPHVVSELLVSSDPNEDSGFEQLLQSMLLPKLQVEGSGLGLNISPPEGNDVVGQWFKDALRFMVQISELFKSASQQPPSAVFREVVMQSLIKIRPKLEPGNDRLLVPICVRTFLELACEWIIEFPLVQPAYKLVVAEIILQELLNQDAPNFDELSAVKSWPVQTFDEILSGTLFLLGQLVMNDPVVFEKLLQRNTHLFLLKGCLGVSLPAEPEEMLSAACVVPICTSRRSKQAAYQILKHMCDLSPILARTVTLDMEAIHNVVLANMPEGFSYKPETDVRSSTGYVGLRNLGSTCYANSCLQQLFMIPSFRHQLLAVNLTHNLPREDDLVYQLQHMFSYLATSHRKAYKPQGWARAYKDESGMKPINTSLQQDAQEFLCQLCDRLEMSLKDTQQARLINDTLTGKMCNQLIKEGGTGVDGDIREREEPFYCLGLQVQGIKSLELSLENFCQGERITNYVWDDDVPRVNITKRQCISSLPPTLIFHLKRFDLNLDTFLREKINDEFQFPMSVNMFPYTKEGLAQRDRSNTNNNSQIPHSNDVSHLLRFQYRLAGVVVHTGTAESGHYYSFIRERVPENTDSLQSGRWFEFNDSEVRDFSTTQIPSQCFGGLSSMHEYNATTKTWTKAEVATVKNAYMLVYERLHGSDDDTEQVPSPSPTVSDIIRECVTDNRKHTLHIRACAPPHMGVLPLLLKATQMCVYLTESGQEASAFLKKVTDFTLGVMSRSGQTGAFRLMCRELATIYSSSVEESAKFLKCICETPVFDKIRELVFAPDAKVREGVCVLLWAALEIVSKLEGTNMIKDVHELRKGTLTYLSDAKPAALPPAPPAPTNNGMAEEEPPQTDEELSIVPTSNPVEIDAASQPDTTASTFMCLFTSDRTLQIMAESWRRSHQYGALLMKWCQCSWIHRHFCVYRGLILGITDVILVDSSPAVGHLYIKGTRKKASSSYVSIPEPLQTFDQVAPGSKDLGAEPLANEWQPAPVPATQNKGTSGQTISNTPDWSPLVCVLSQLVMSSRSHSMVSQVDIPPTLLPSDCDAPEMSDWDFRCLKTKSLYLTLLKQHRYTSFVADIITHTCHEWLNFSSDVSDTLVESLSFSSPESTKHIFHVIHSFLGIHDSLSKERASFLFAWEGPSPQTQTLTHTKSHGKLLDMLHELQDINPRLVCVCLRSVCALISEFDSVKDCLRGPSPGKTQMNTHTYSYTSVSKWAPWVLKFSYKFKERCIKEHEATLAVSTSYTAVTGDSVADGSSLKAPCFTVYGEPSHESDSRWDVRASNLFDRVGERVRLLGGDPDTLIPLDAFEFPAAHNALRASNGGTNADIDDAEFARQLQQMEDMGITSLD